MPAGSSSVHGFGTAATEYVGLESHRVSVDDFKPSSSAAYD